jgi:hypothetical protein
MEKLTFYSGAARGADTYWADALRKLGHNVIEFMPMSLAKLTDKEKADVEKNYLEVASLLNRHILDYNTYPGKLVRRDMLQANNGESLFAISYLDKNGFVSGCTAYASTRMILRRKPVYLFDQTKCVWYERDYSIGEYGKFVEIKYTPLLINKSTVVGSRDLTIFGKRAINMVIELSFKNNE